MLKAVAVHETNELNEPKSTFLVNTFIALYLYIFISYCDAREKLNTIRSGRRVRFGIKIEMIFEI